MTLLTIQILILSIAAGIFGSILGLGGGIIITPALTLLFGIDIKYAIGASIVSVIATSSGAAIAYIKDKITNIRIGMFLEIATTIGAITGAFISGLIDSKYLYVIFGVLLLYSAVAMLKKKGQELPKDVKTHPMAEKLSLNGEYYDKVLKQKVSYNVDGVYGGFSMMYVAGVISGLLGIGSGIFKVMAMDLFMKLPLKVSSATSNFMIGVTAAASAGVYLLRGNIDPKIAAPVALGVLIGATIGTKIMQNLRSKTIRMIFIPVLVFVSIQMIVKGFKL
ncbi:sulfite exporter TauE/SafE family protein [Clostridium sp. YIM B02515]|uniref:Probable membrane transporter protein n=1 Tax=Clostridium rhizosphaerae TaxID=2803861 RepID=A0ABS1TG22_9CLOT|nr:sulfite exporter TauE/SafE family protein [Clostridium rhizosphaerae]MBL4938325.1 sulfite exporter TauE/SafE family protein [Clostridium rhizosphaerae]